MIWNSCNSDGSLLEGIRVLIEEIGYLQTVSLRGQTCLFRSLQAPTACLGRPPSQVRRPDGPRMPPIPGMRRAIRRLHFLKRVTRLTVSEFGNVIPDIRVIQVHLGVISKKIRREFKIQLFEVLNPSIKIPNPGVFTKIWVIYVKKLEKIIIKFVGLGQKFMTSILIQNLRI